MEYLTLHNQVRSLNVAEYKKLHSLYNLKAETGELSLSDERKFQRLRRRGEIDLLDSADVICTTCIASADRRLRTFRFQYVLIDEATQAIEPECLLPALKGAR